MYIATIFTLLVGLSFLIGISFLNNNKHKIALSNYTMSLAFIVLVGLLFLDLLPEIFETKKILLIIPIIIGFLGLIILDKFIPHHHHDHKSDKECDHDDHDMHLNHISIITIVALCIHNIIEGISLYGVTLDSISSGLLMLLSIFLHNVPLGFSIGNSLENTKYKKSLITLLCLSSFIGALIMIIFGNLNEIVISVLLTMTFGMLTYIAFFELMPEVIKNIKKKECLYGIITGIVILIIAFIVL